MSIGTKGKEQSSRPLFLGWLPENVRPIKLIGNNFTLYTVLKLVASSAGEAKLGALFLNVKRGE